MQLVFLCRVCRVFILESCIELKSRIYHTDKKRRCQFALIYSFLAVNSVNKEKDHLVNCSFSISRRLAEEKLFTKADEFKVVVA